MEPPSAIFRLKNDRYAKVRDGNSHFLNIYCVKCGQHLALYQKDGQGSLLRMYLDRIMAPPEFAELELRYPSKSTVPPFKCPHCQSLIGVPMVYEPEKRLAFRLIPGSFAKKKSSGAYPPKP